MTPSPHPLRYLAAFLCCVTALSAPFSIDAYGALPGIDTHAQALLNGQAFASAVAAANASADPASRAVLVPAGNVYSFLPAVPSLSGVADVIIYIEGGLNVSTADFSTSYPGWPNPWSPISFSDARNLSLISTTQRGVINGRGNAWW